MIKIFRLFVIGYMLSLSWAFGQVTSSGITKARITFTSDTVLNNNFIVELDVQDTLNIQTIDLSLGSRVDSTNIFTYEFPFDVNSGLPNSVTYNRVGHHIILNLGAQQKYNMYFCKVRIKNDQNVYGLYHKFIAN